MCISDNRITSYFAWPSFSLRLFAKPPFSLAACISALGRSSVQSVHSQNTRERFVGEALTSRFVGERADAIRRVNLTIASAAQAERKFIDIALHVLDGEMVIDPVVAALQDRPHAFDAIRVRHTVYVLLGAVIDCAMVVAIDASVGRMGIRAEHRIIFDVRCHGVLNGLRIGIVNHNRLNVSAALTHAENSSFANCTATLVQFFVLVLIVFLAANVRLIRFNDSQQHAPAVRIIAARLANPLHHEPRGLLRDAEFLGNLHRRNALACGGNQVHRIQPFIQGDVRALENCPRAHGEVLLARETAEITDDFANLNTINVRAMRARRRTFPASRFKVGARCRFVRKLLEKFVMANGDFHGENLTSMERFNVH